MPGVLVKMGNLDAGPWGEYHVTLNAEIRVMGPQAEECARLPANH